MTLPSGALKDVGGWDNPFAGVASGSYSFTTVAATLGHILISLPRIRTKLNAMNCMSGLGKMEV